MDHILCKATICIVNVKGAIHWNCTGREVGLSIARAVECWLRLEGHQLLRGCEWHYPALPWEQHVSQDAWLLSLAWLEDCPISEPSTAS